MTKPARNKLTLRVQAAAKTIPGTTCYGHGGTEIIFSPAAALICHQGVDGHTVGDIADNVDTLLGTGAFERLLATGTFMTSDETTLDEPSQLYSLSVDPALIAELDAARVPVAETVEAPAVETVAETADAPAIEVPVVETVAADDGFVDDKVFSQGCEDEVAFDASKEAMVIEGPKGDQIEIDLTAGEIVFATTKQGAPFATIRTPGERTTMAFGPVAEALRGKTKATCIVTMGRSTNKIVAVYGDNDEMIFELPRAA